MGGTYASKATRASGSTRQYSGVPERDLMAKVINKAKYEAEFARNPRVRREAREWLLEGWACIMYCDFLDIDHDVMIERITKDWDYIEPNTQAQGGKLTKRDIAFSKDEPRYVDVACSECEAADISNNIYYTVGNECVDCSRRRGLLSRAKLRAKNER